MVEKIKKPPRPSISFDSENGVIQLERTGAMIQIIIVFILFRNVWPKCGSICLLKVKIQLEHVFHWITFTGLKHLLCARKNGLNHWMELDSITIDKRIQSKQFQKLEKRKQKQKRKHFNYYSHFDPKNKTKP